MKGILNYIVTNFGFLDLSDFGTSLVHKNWVLGLIPLAGVSSIIETTFGLQGLTILAFAVLVMLELLTGLMASKVKGEPIVSKKFGRFGLKMLVWLTLMFVINSLKKEYVAVDGNFNDLAAGLFTWLHGTLFIYVNLEYLISVLENLGVISGRNNESIIKLIKKKFFKIQEDDDNETLV
jgi:hypothetical protein